MAKKKPEEHENAERWLVSYADFITLLFAFFVVMYAISSLNEGKYRVLSTAIVNAFRSGSTLSLTTTPPSGAANTMIQVPETKPIAKAVSSHSPLQEQAKLGNLAAELRRVMEPLIKKDLVKIFQNEQGIEIEIKDSALFPIGQAQPSPQSRTMLTRLAHVLSPVNNAISVEGFTDNVPISTVLFPSNWELSAGRAGSVVRLFQENGVAFERLVAIGRAENMPVADNSTVEGRAHNRRVLVRVLANIAGGVPSPDLARHLEEATQKLSAPSQPPKD